MTQADVVDAIVLVLDVGVVVIWVWAMVWVMVGMLVEVVDAAIE